MLGPRVEDRAFEPWKVNERPEKKGPRQLFVGNMSGIDCTTQLYGDYNKPIQGFLLSNQDSMESKGPRLFFVAQMI